ncbi:MAG: ABC transporter ATP-binding protein [Eggerthellaceae bacterium]|nr:ABC transporter ATP-binding protein [Eggerthellaceae bacterium]
MNARSEYKRRRAGISIMARLIVLVSDMIPVMLLAIALGVVGFLCAIFITVFAGYGLVYGASLIAPEGIDVGLTWFGSLLTSDIVWFFGIVIGMAVARGLLHYGEQYCNHYIAFKMLAIIRHKVFVKLRSLAPAKLEGRDKGDLISLITSDIELLEVFYAHTISPIAIAVLVSAFMVWFQFQQHQIAGFIALAAYVVVGIFVPLWNGRRGAGFGLDIRNEMGDLNAFVLDSLYGLDETIQYEGGRARARQIDERSRSLGVLQGALNVVQRSQVSLTDLLIQIFSWGMLFSMLVLFMRSEVAFGSVVVATIAMMGSFGPVSALSNLSTTLSGTLAAGDRVLDLMDEQPEVLDVEDGLCTSFGGAQLESVDFAYDSEQILSEYSLAIPKGKIIGLHGPSGSGKSTILKLLMRFWDVDGGSVSVSGHDVRDVNTDGLRSMESYVTQETWLFHSSIADNISIGRPDSTRRQITEAARKASLHEFVKNLPNGYDTLVGELGDNLSGGERQRIGLARAFLHDAPFMLLDEPTSNLDSLNEAVILKSLAEQAEGKTIVLVSHRASTMSVVDEVHELNTARAS